MNLLEKVGLAKPKDPLEDLKKWKRDLAKEMRTMDREVRNIEAAEKKSMDECRKLGKQGRTEACKIIAKEILRTRAARDRMLQSKAQLSSISMQLQTQASLVRAAGCMARSADVMKAMNKLVKVPQMQKTMLDMAREMERAGLIEDVMNDALDVIDSDDIEEESDLQINAVVTEITGDLFKNNQAVPTALPQTQQQQEAAVEDEAPAAQEEDLDAMKARLQAL